MVQREILTGGERGGEERRKGEREKHVVLNSEQVKWYMQLVSVFLVF